MIWYYISRAAEYVSYVVCSLHICSDPEAWHNSKKTKSQGTGPSDFPYFFEVWGKLMISKAAFEIPEFGHNVLSTK